MIQLYNTILFRPLFNLLVLIYKVIPGGDFGLAIIILTLIIRFIFVPLSIKSLISQKELSRLQPKMKELQEKYKNDKAALNQATMALYKEHGINPFSGCLPLLIQLPVLIALYSALRTGLRPDSLSALYSFVSHPATIKTISLGFLDLTQKSPVLAVLAGVLQWFQSKQAVAFQAPAKNEQASTAFQMNKQMLYFFPVMVIIIAWNLPTGLVLYWVTATIFSIFEQLYINKKYNPKP